MALSHDTQAQADSELERRIAGAQALGQARALAQALINYDRNENPMRHREAENPAHGVRIRVLRPALHVRVKVDEETKAHNDAVANLRKP